MSQTPEKRPYNMAYAFAALLQEKEFEEARKFFSDWCHAVQVGENVNRQKRVMVFFADASFYALETDAFRQFRGW